MALKWWGHVVQDDVFWSYLQERVEKADHIQIRTEDIAEVRAKLPEALLGFNSLFASNYGLAARRLSGNSPNQIAGKLCGAHLGLINTSPLPVGAKQGAISNVVNALVRTGLDPVLEHLREKVQMASGRLTVQEFAERCDSMVGSVIALRDYLRGGLHLTEKMLHVAEFDRFCEDAVKCINSKLDYQGGERQRALLYGLITCVRLLALPVSGPVRLQLERVVKEHQGHLYPDLDLSKDFDCSKCYFLPYQEADALESLLMPIYKITDHKGGNVRWISRDVIIPRSKLAAQYHRGQVNLHDIEHIASKDTEGLLGQIRAIDREEQELVARRNQRLQVELQELTSACAVQLNQLNARMSCDEERAKEHIRKQLEAEKADIEKLDTKLAADLLAVEESFKPRRETLEKEWKVRRSASGRLVDFLAIEAPICGGILAVLAGVVHHLTPQMTVSLGMFAGCAAAGGIALGILIGGIRRRQTIRALPDPLKALEDEMRSQEEVARTLHAKSLIEVKNTHGLSIARAQSWLDQLEKSKAAVLANTTNEKLQAERAASGDIAAARNAANSRRAPLQAKLHALVKPKSESDKISFPPYFQYRSQGFNDGTKPSDSEVQQLVQQELNSFLNSLTPNERAMLQLAQVLMSEKEFVNLLGALLAMTPSERREKLGQFPG